MSDDNEKVERRDDTPPADELAAARERARARAGDDDLPRKSGNSSAKS